ncbi:hypothetical protein [Desulfosporosinus hippei]|uniref:Uncharacterized protein n=1 Tax=Desulfosporosinus hippei DSM 8344 TaxID=1121419 RepID=A0A1G8CEN6_9FIRM|nr:hypothetical protein [Desulfosporosinus hippei]SDH43350.1 hypothetical protein SAMN05443529_11366 [Desulfosporosinus hippei DSM 8344]
MKKFDVYQNIEGNNLKQLLLFVGKYSNKMSFARYYEGKLTEEEFNQLQMEYKESILEEDKKNRLHYKENVNGYRDRINNFCRTDMNVEEYAEKYFNHLLEQDIMSCNLNYERFEKGKYEPYKRTSTDFLYVKYTRRTPVTRGPVFEMCFFMVGETYRKLLLNMNKLFEYPYQIEGGEFEDLTFYKEERLLLAICSHERYAYMNLEDDEYQEFLKLDILSDLTER